MNVHGRVFLLVVSATALLPLGCTKIQVKQYYLLNYSPSSVRDRLNPGAYPCTIRLREFDIEAAYTQPQIVYRQSPFQLRYYVYRVWAVKPQRMVTDLLHKHLLAANLVSNVVRRFDEVNKPDYEINGIIEAIEEYDSDELWFAHIALRLNLIRLRDGRTMYSRRFDHRKRVFQHEPEYVVREMSALMEYTFTQAIHDFDAVLSAEFGTPQSPDEQRDVQEQETIIPTTPIDSAVIEEQQ
ncbi:MAG: membrane integrity-associated transporter subunit PqiC [Chitinispirillaceae bacterium]|nr:membrane integrity-associated transporter subunit PqiC [Chitinispirillaceae bacterium]